MVVGMQWAGAEPDGAACPIQLVLLAVVGFWVAPRAEVFPAPAAKGFVGCPCLLESFFGVCGTTTKSSESDSENNPNESASSQMALASAYLPLPECGVCQASLVCCPLALAYGWEWASPTHTGY